VIEPGTVCNEIMSHMDWIPTLLAAVGDADIKEKLLKGHKAGDKTFNVHLDGYNFLPYFKGDEDKGPRKEFFYFSDEGDLVGFRYDNWKMVFMEQRCEGTCAIWSDPWTILRTPKLFNLKTDPYERADVTSNTYWDWMFDHIFLLLAAQKVVGEFLATFQAYPPRQKAATFGVDQVIEKLTAGITSA
jgi:arylsulfatase